MAKKQQSVSGFWPVPGMWLLLLGVLFTASHLALTHVDGEILRWVIRIGTFCGALWIATILQRKWLARSDAGEHD